MKTTAEERALWVNLTGWPKDARQRWKDLLSDVSELEADNTRLRTALERIESGDWGQEGEYCARWAPLGPVATPWILIARQALTDSADAAGTEKEKA
jgi:hypothetical protein